jgi:Ca2+-binding RTX toxin-like protein
MENLVLDPVSQLVTVDNPSPTISVQWDQAVQQAVINTSPGPTIASRAYSILHTAMYDAWSAYDPNAISTQAGDSLQRPLTENTEANKNEAMSFAAYRVLNELFPTQKTIFDQLMSDLGFDISNTTTDPTIPAGIGNISAESLMQFRHNDGSNQLNGFVDTTGYQPVNSSIDSIVDIAKWTPEFVPIDSQSGDNEFLRQQSFLTPQWSVVTPFALNDPSAVRPGAPETFLLVDGATVDFQNATVTLADNSIVPIDSSIVGTIINPEFIEQAEQVVNISANLTDEQKLVAEFWEDGGGTSFPPGTWMTFGQFVSARDNNTVDRDAVLFFALGNAVFDAGIATWESKVFYDYTRPVRAVRELGKLGLLNNGTIGTDAITGETGFVIDAWAGPGVGTQTILADNFLTYQTPGSDPSPPFAEYTSGHSAFSAAGAEILRLFTGSDAFGAVVTFQPGESRFEPIETPAQTVTLAWDTFSVAADEAGISRLYGGIHFDDGDLNGRQLGRTVGQTVWARVQELASSGFIPGLDNIILGTEFNDLREASSAEGDEVRGLEGDDTIIGGPGNDTLNGNSGSDLIEANSSTSTASGNDSLFGGSGGDTLFGSTFGFGGDTLSGNKGNDILYSTIIGGDTMFGGQDEDILIPQGTEASIMNGDKGNDTLFAGTASTDLIFGGSGEDQLIGGAGSAILSGGSDSDEFIFEPTSTFAGVTTGGFGGADTINDFRAGSGTADVLIINQLDKDATVTFTQSDSDVVVTMSGNASTPGLSSPENIDSQTIVLEDVSITDLLGFGSNDVFINGVVANSSNADGINNNGTSFTFVVGGNIPGRAGVGLAGTAYV